jgi:hypothetical protein
MQTLRRGAVFQIERAAFAALCVLALSFGVEAWRHPIALGELHFTNLEILQFLVVFLWIVYHNLRFQDDGVGHHLPRGLSLTLGLWLVVLGLSTFLAPGHRDQALAFDGRILRGAALAWATFDLTRSTHRLKRLMRCLALGGIIVCVLGLIEVTNILPLRPWLVDLRGDSALVGDLLRLSSTLGHPNIAAVAIELTLFPTLAWTLETQKRWLRVCLGVGLLAGLLALILTFSRGGLIAFLISLLLIIGLAGYYRTHRALILGGAAIMVCLAGAAGVLALSDPSIALRFSTEDADSWYQATYAVSDSVSARPGEPVTLPIRLTNTGQRTWQANGEQAFHLSYHLSSLSTSGQIVQYEGQRTALPGDVPPGQSVVVMATVITPQVSGQYLIAWDMVQEHVTWFSTRNAPMAETRLTLQGQPVGSAVPFSGVPFPDKAPLLVPKRLTLWKTALQIALEHPVFGIGPDNFRLTYGEYLGSTNSNTGIHANNMYLEWLADTGFVGLLTFLWMSLTLARTAWRTLKQYLLESSGLWRLALIGSLTAWYLHGFVDYFYEYTPVSILFWILVGLSISAAPQEPDTRSASVAGGEPLCDAG